MRQFYNTILVLEKKQEIEIKNSIVFADSEETALKLAMRSDTFLDAIADGYQLKTKSVELIEKTACPQNAGADVYIPVDAGNWALGVFINTEDKTANDPFLIELHNLLEKHTNGFNLLSFLPK